MSAERDAAEVECDRCGNTVVLTEDGTQLGRDLTSIFDQLREANAASTVPKTSRYACASSHVKASSWGSASPTSPPHEVSISTNGVAIAIMIRFIGQSKQTDPALADYSRSMPITPDTKNWTWVLERPCPDCGFDPADHPRERFGTDLRKVNELLEGVVAKHEGVVQFERSRTLFYGFDANEQKRIRRRATIAAGWGYETAYPLAHWKRTIQSTREIGVEPPLGYSTFKHANCVGCLKAGWQHWYIVYATRPDVWRRGKDAEDDIGYTIHKDASLDEREEQFAAMLAAGVEPTEHVPSGAFWADARRKVRSLPVLQEETDARPCECVFVRPPKRGARDTSTPCTCLAPPGEGHALWCARALGERVAA